MNLNFNSKEFVKFMLMDFSVKILFYEAVYVCFQIIFLLVN